MHPIICAAFATATAIISTATATATLQVLLPLHNLHGLGDKVHHVPLRLHALRGVRGAAQITGGGADTRALEHHISQLDRGLGANATEYPGELVASAAIDEFTSGAGFRQGLVATAACGARDFG